MSRITDTKYSRHHSFWSRLLCSVAGLGWVLTCSAQISINEYSAHKGIFDGEEESDWIELINTSSSPISLGEYALSDDPTEPDKWPCPDYVMQADEILLICASGLDLDTKVDHWESVVLAENDWQYFPGNSAPPADWNQLGFDASTWNVGAGGIGYGDGDDNTFISPVPSLFMRQEFTIDDLSHIGAAVLSADFDDGYVAYLNGVEIARSDNLFGQPPGFDTYTTSFEEAQLYLGGSPSYEALSQEQLESVLIEGENVLAVQVHNFSPTSSDLSAIFYLSVGISDASMTYAPVPSWFDYVGGNQFYHTDFKLSPGEYILLSQSQTVVDIDAIPDDLSYGLSRGRSADGSGSWCYFEVPNPGLPNNTTCFEGVAAAPLFGLPSGWYASAQSTTVSSPGSTVHFTTNGDIPDTEDPIASGPLDIPETGIISARAFSDEGLLPSQVVDRTYIIGQDNHELPVMSIKTDSLNLWDFYEGIYVSGPNPDSNYPFFGSNFWQPWSKFARLEFFTGDQSLVAEEHLDLEIHGGWSRAEPQKSFRLDFKSKYTGRLEVPLFSEKSQIPDFNNLNLRNGGQHVWSDKIQDALISRLSKDTHVDYSAYEPCIVYLNGDYWGIYGIREKVDEHYIEDNHDIPDDQVDLLNAEGVLAGTDEKFIADYSYMMNIPAGNVAFYGLFSTRFDIENYIDYFIIETFVENLDWMGIAWQPNNIKVWRPQTPEGKWRYVLYDTDAGLGAFGTAPSQNYIEMARNPSQPNMHSELFDRALDNEQFRCAFTRRYADLTNSIFRQSVVDAHVESMSEQLAPAMPDHVERWQSPPSVIDWMNAVEFIRNRFSVRMPYARLHVNTTLELGGQHDLTLDVEPAGAGRIQVSTLTPEDYPWSGVYFNGCPIGLEALPDSGFVFSHWSANAHLPGQVEDASLSVDLEEDDLFTAHFTTITDLEEESGFEALLI
ncbi:MAG: hypothetical protein HKN79_10170, partial [Flavobacteriales bacterium]|nr:hypothetical protein [Flavobacteriales bacterium]